MSSRSVSSRSKSSHMRSDDPGAKLTAVPSTPPVRRSDGCIGGTEYILAGALGRRHVARGPMAPEALSFAERRTGRPVFAAPPHPRLWVRRASVAKGNDRPSTTTLTHAGVGGVQTNVTKTKTGDTCTRVHKRKQWLSRLSHGDNRAHAHGKQISAVPRLAR